MPNSLPFNGNPKEVKLRRSATGGIKHIRIYGDDGYPYVNIDFGHDHGQGDPHYHIWDHTPGNIPTSNNRRRGIPVHIPFNVQFLWEKGLGYFHDGILTNIIQDRLDFILYIDTFPDNFQKIVKLKKCSYHYFSGKNKGVIYELVIAKGLEWRQIIRSSTNDNKILWRLTKLKSTNPKRKDIENQISEGHLNLVVLFPSYGPEVFVLCKNVEGINE